MRDYPTLTVRVPPEDRALLKALSARQQVPMWRLLGDLTRRFVDALPAAERRAIARAAGPTSARALSTRPARQTRSARGTSR